MSGQQRKHLFIVNDFPPLIGGQSAYLYHVCRSFGPRMDVLAPCGHGTAAFDAAQPFRIFRRRYLSPVFIIDKALKVLVPLGWVLGYLRREKVGLLHCAHVMSTGFIGWWLKRLCGLDYVIYTHAADVLEYREHFFWGFWLRKVLGNARWVVTVSRFMQAELEALGVEKGRIIVSHPRVDPDDFVRRTDRREVLERLGLDGQRFILSVNRLVDRKGNDVVIRAMPGLLRKFPGLVYVVFGSGPFLDRLKGLAGELKVAGSVVFIQGGDDERKVLLQACDVFVMPSREGSRKGDVEGFGIVYLEAAVCGKPVVAGNSGGVADALEDGVTGWCVDALDPVAVGCAVEKVLSDENLLSRMGAAGQTRVFARFDARRGSPELDVIFKEAALA